MDWLAALTHLRADGLPGVLVTVTDVRGHAPRDAGAKMVVGAESTWDSIGGGNLEATVVDRARELLAGGAHVPERMTFALNEHVANRHGNQCCGGEVSVLLEPLLTRSTVAVFGVGHVGLELGRIVARLPVTLHLVDSRSDQVSPDRLTEVSGPADVHVHHAPAPEVVLRNLPAGSYVFVMTHDHAEDFILCDAALNRGDLAYVGLIGSHAKWVRFRKRLGEAGHDDAAISTITSPIGVEGIIGKTPAVIAVSAAAELVQLLEREQASVGSGGTARQPALRAARASQGRTGPGPAGGPASTSVPGPGDGTAAPPPAAVRGSADAPHQPA
ncbi:molybdenum cofactor sulfurylase [Georgenia soli]|uniref:Molybdenum cofactor sulfurylase n=1 Tax=Georgenia soli TaxID=638953 RepID=A0A2A9ESE6_9MICO|nr:molybdenum cofactor sulfurylase [Georgenia soli]